MADASIMVRYSDVAMLVKEIPAAGNVKSHALFTGSESLSVRVLGHKPMETMLPDRTADTSRKE
jgi:hypothetical protein